MKRLTFLLIVTPLFNLCFAQGSSKTGIVTKDLTVTGTIKNLDEFRSLVIPGTTCIQLVPISADGKLKLVYSSDASHRIREAFESNLPKLPVPRKAAFSFKIAKIPAGRYIIAVQKLESRMNTTSHVDKPILVTEAGSPFIIEILAEAKSPVRINAGSLSLPMH